MIRYIEAMTRRQQTVLITGANGFVGSRLVRRFSADGYHVVAGVRQSADCSLLADLKPEFRYGDVTDPESLVAMVGGVDLVVHNAGLVKAKSRERFFEVNETGTWNLCEAVAQHNPELTRIIHISSVAVMGPSTAGQPLRESDTPAPVTDYAESKLAGEKAALSYADRLPVTIIRPHAVYGPGDKEIFTLFRTVNNRIRPYVGDVNRRIHMIHVDDLSRAVSLAARAQTESGTAYFIAEAQSYTLREMIEILCAAAGRRGIPLYVPSPVFRAVAAISEFTFKLAGATPMLTRNKVRELDATWEIDVSRARTQLGFEAAISFAEGARDTYDWYRRKGWLS